MDLSKTLFISDLHLTEIRPDLACQFFTFLDGCDSSVDAIYILGDLFEFWIGDDDDAIFTQTVITALKNTTLRGIPIYVTHGNRDFLLGKKFFAESGCQLLPELKKINLYGDEVLLLHGDTLCTLDVAYLKARKYLRNPFLQKLFLMMPLSLRKRIAGGFRKRSENYTSTAINSIMDVTDTAVNDLIHKYAVRNIIHGHTHRRAIHELKLQAFKAYRFVLGAWEENANVLEWDNNGQKRFLLL